MHQACSEGHVQCLKALLEAGATIDGCDCRGHKPVDLAKLWGHRTCARYHVGMLLAVIMIFFFFVFSSYAMPPCTSHRPSHSSNFYLSLARVFSTSYYLVGISVPNTFLSMCFSSLLITCPHQFNRLPVFFFGSLHHFFSLVCVRSRSCMCVSFRKSFLASSSRSAISKLMLAHACKIEINGSLCVNIYFSY